MFLPSELGFLGNRVYVSRVVPVRVVVIQGGRGGVFRRRHFSRNSDCISNWLDEGKLEG